MTGRHSRVEHLSDEALLSGLAIGDRDATTAFIRRFQSRVFSVARAVVYDQTTAEEVAQQAFERAWRHAHMYDPRRGSVRAWLTTITRNLAIDQMRARHTLPLERVDDILDLEDPARGPDEQVEGTMAVRRLRLALGALPPEQSRALVLAAVLGLSRAEIAELENVPEGTVKTRIHAAMMKLRLALDEQVAEP